MYLRLAADDSWRWIFYINIPVGILTTLLVYKLLEDPPFLPRKKSLANFDYIGFALLIIGVGALQVALDKGQEDDWFGSHFITTLFVLAALGLFSMVLWEWFHKDPLVDIRLFNKNFNFTSCNLMFFAMGAAILSQTVLLPQFLQTLMGYTAESAGMVLSASAVLLLCLARRWQAHCSLPSTSSAGIWVDLNGCRYVHFVQADRSVNKFFSHGVVAHYAVSAGRVFDRAAYNRRI
jgi:MFS family permease